MNRLLSMSFIFTNHRKNDQVVHERKRAFLITAEIIPITILFLFSNIPAAVLRRQDSYEEDRNCGHLSCINIYKWHVSFHSILRRQLN